MRLLSEANELQTDDSIRMLEKLDISIQTQHAAINVDWFRAIHHNEVPNASWHEHRNVEMHFVVNGAVTFNFPDRTVNVMSGQAILIPANVPHQLQNQSGQMYYRYVLKFSIQSKEEDPEARFMADTLNVRDVRVISIYGRVIDLLEECMREAVDRINCFRMVIESSILSILILVTRELSDSAKAAYVVSEKKNVDEQRVQQIIALIESDGSYSITVEELAKKLYLSPRQIQRIVQRQCGLTIRELMMKSRLSRAKDLLKESQMSMSEIASQLGFANQQSFNRFFRKMDGEPPASYRNSAVSKRMQPVPHEVEKTDE